LGFESHGPGQVRLQRSRVDVHVLSVKVEAGLQTQAVACAEAAGSDSGLCQGLPEARRFSGRQQNFESVLAGVAGAGDEVIAVAGGAERLDLSGVGGAQQLDDLIAGLGPLYGDDRQVIALDDLDVEVGGHAVHPGEIIFASGRVEHAAEKLIIEPVGQKVVNHAAVFIEHARIQRLALFSQAGQIIGQQTSHKLTRSAALNVNDGHVGH